MKKRDVTIVGGGIAGLTTAFFAARENLITTLIDNQGASGGVLINVESIQNFPGFPDGVSGYELGPTIANQAVASGAEFMFGSVTEIRQSASAWELFGDFDTVLTSNLVVATGSQPKRLSISKEEELYGHGISYCATCDGDFFRDEDVVIAGGGDAALDEALVLAEIVKSATIIHHGDSPTGSKATLDRVQKLGNVRLLANSEVIKLLGDDALSGVSIRDERGSIDELKCTGLFVYVGSEPQTHLLQDFCGLDASGHVAVNRQMATSVTGLYAVGDIRQRSSGLLLGSAADGMAAARAIAAKIRASSD